MRKPFFSIVIPTFNSGELLKATIAITLKQTFKDFELIVSNNCSIDETREVIKSFKDKRIRYYENKKNIGAEANIKKIMSYTRGEYIFSLGDDDFILFDDTLEKVKKILDKKRWGFIRINLLEKRLDGQGLRKSFITTEKNFSLSSHASPENIFDFFSKIAASHLAGLVIKNRKNLSDEFIDCSYTPWIKVLYETVKADGGFFMAGEYMVITWCRIGEQTGVSHHYDVPLNNRLMFEEYTDFIFRQIPTRKLADFKYYFYSRFIMLQPVIKLYSSNNNLIRFNRRLLELEPRLKRNPLFCLMAITAFLMPKFIWQIVRIIQHQQKDVLGNLSNKEKIISRFTYLDKLFSHQKLV